MHARAGRLACGELNTTNNLLIAHKGVKNTVMSSCDRALGVPAPKVSFTSHRGEPGHTRDNGHTDHSDENLT